MNNTKWYVNIMKSLCKDEYKDLVTTLDGLGGEPVSPVTPARLFGIATVASLLGYWMFSSFK